MIRHAPIEHAHYGNSMRRLRIGQTPAPTHVVCRPVAAFPIVATDHLADGVVSVLISGEVVLADVPRGFASLSTPVQHDMLIIGPDGEITHRARALFDAEAEAIRAVGPWSARTLLDAELDTPRAPAARLNADGDRMPIRDPQAERSAA